MLEKSQGVPLEIKFTRETIVFYLHPDGANPTDSVAMRLKVEHMQRAALRLMKVEKQLNAGTIDDEKYVEEIEGIDNQKAELLKSLGERRDKQELTAKEYDDAVLSIEKDYKQNCVALLNARDGQPCSIEDNERLEKEADYWQEKANLRPIAVPYLRSCVIDWNRTSESGEKIPLTFDTLNQLTEDQLKLTALKVKAFYDKDAVKEKKPTENSESPLVTTKENLEQSLNGFRSIELQEPTELTPMKLPDGDSENLTAHSQN